MSSDLRNIKDKIDRIFVELSGDMKRLSLWVKIVLILVGSTVAGGAAFFSGPVGWPLDGNQLLGLTGLFLALIGGIFVSVSDRNLEDTLVAARQAVGRAEDAIADVRMREVNSDLREFEIDNVLDDYDDAVQRLAALYNCMSSARNTLEPAILAGVSDEIGLIKACLENMKRDLVIALGFAPSDFWTICIYRAEMPDDNGPALLRLAAHDRSIPCELSKARVWKDGVGVGGIAYAKNDEVLVPNLDDPAVGTAFRLPGDFYQASDSERYKSIFAVPVSVGHDEKPWGIVLATSDSPDYFNHIHEPGVDILEAIRALAGIVALAIASCRVPQTD